MAVVRCPRGERGKKSPWRDLSRESAAHDSGSDREQWFESHGWLSYHTLGTPQQSQLSRWLGTVPVVCTRQLNQRLSLSLFPAFWYWSASVAPMDNQRSTIWGKDAIPVWSYQRHCIGSGGRSLAHSLVTADSFLPWNFRGNVD
jgi:hypothetical protein